jgi:hypothetical protein
VSATAFVDPINNKQNTIMPCIKSQISIDLISDLDLGDGEIFRLTAAPLPSRLADVPRLFKATP